VIELIERLLGKGHELRIYDKNVNVASLVGANRDFILNRIPHISRLMAADMDTVLQHAQTVVIGNKDPDFKDVPRRIREDQRLVDLVRISDQRSGDGNYSGICW
jgi:GDP-mannose 6-dehydrogenase